MSNVANTSSKQAMEYDVIAFGGGFSGMLTAYRCAQLGLKAAVLERESDDRYICNSRLTTGVFAVMYWPPSSTEEELYNAIIAATDGTADKDLARTGAAAAKRAIEWFKKEGVRFIEVPGGHGKLPMLAPPRRMKDGLDWEGRGGDVLLRKLEENLIAHGGALLRGTRVTSFVMHDGACVGVNVERHGLAERIDAKTIVVADGGFQANLDMVRSHITPAAERVLLRASQSGNGDGIRMAGAIGAAVSGFGKFYGHIQHRDAMHKPGLWPYPTFDAIAEASIVVGADGKRFTDEGLGGVCIANAVAQLQDPLSATVVFDEAIWSGGPGKARPVAANPFLMSGGGWLHSADNLEALAEKAGLSVTGLVATVHEYNSKIASSAIGDLSPQRSTAHFKPMPIIKPPFHAVPLCAGITQSMGGIEIDRNAQALNLERKPIPGLYSVGASVSGVEGGPQAGYFGGIGKAFIWSLIAAEHIAASLKSNTSAA